MIHHHGNRFREGSANELPASQSPVILPRERKRKLRMSLEQNGIDLHLIYPDLPGLVMRLKREREDSYDSTVEDRKRWYPPASRPTP
jgi:hypothetical protein